MSGASGLAQQNPTTPPASAGTVQAATAPKLSPADLEEMLAPIALYPDTLLASTLAACVYEEDFKAAAKFMAGGGKADQIAGKEWDPSVKAIASMPEVIKLLGDNVPWAVAVGQAYLTQGADVMAAVQSLRARAWANGALKTTPQQTVVTEGQTIIIEPVNPQVIYVPTYNPSVVYVSSPSSNDAAAAGIIGFGVGVATGLIIANNMDCNWHGGCVGYGYHGDVDVAVNVNNNTNINVNNTNINNRPGQQGAQWQPNQAKISPSAASGSALNSYKGVSSGGSAAAVPGRTAGAKPIAAGGAPPAPKPRTAETARPSAPTQRSAEPKSKPSAPAAKPSAPASKPAASPSSSPRSSGLNPSGGGGSRGGGGGRGGGRGR